MDGSEVDLEQFYQLHAGLVPDGQALLMTTGSEVEHQHHVLAGKVSPMRGAEFSILTQINAPSLFGGA